VEYPLPTAKEVRESQAIEALVAQLDDDVRERIAAEEIEIRGFGEKGNLILVDAKTKQYVKGTDRPAGSPDMAAVGKANGFKNTNAYREAWQSMFNLAGEQGGVGFEELMDKLWWAANGAEQLVECAHDGCGKRHMVAFKPDAKILFSMVESMIGRASQQVEVNGAVGHVHAVLREAAENASASGVEVWSVNPQDPEGEAERRKIALLESGDIEADWFEEDAPAPE
jgi:hypothetical protein